VVALQLDLAKVLVTPLQEQQAPATLVLLIALVNRSKAHAAGDHAL